MQKHPDVEICAFDFDYHGNVYMDDMHCKGHFGVNHHINELVTVQVKIMMLLEWSS